MRSGAWRCRWRGPGFVSGAVLGFAHTVGEFGVVLMIGGNIPGRTRVLSVAVYEHVEMLQWREAHLLAGGMLAIRLPGDSGGAAAGTAQRAVAAMSVAPAQVEACFAGTLGGFRLQVSFQFPASGVTALFGPSGSGKTTILRCIAGLQRLPGSLQVGDETWHGRCPRRVPQAAPAAHRLRVPGRRAWFPHLSVRGNLLYGARRAGVPPALTFPAVVEMLGLGLLLERIAGGAVGGRAAARGGGGAPCCRSRACCCWTSPCRRWTKDAREEIVSYFEVLDRELSIPMLYVSHDLAEVARLSDHLVVLDAGRQAGRGAGAPDSGAPRPGPGRGALRGGRGAGRAGCRARRPLPPEPAAAWPAGHHRAPGRSARWRRGTPTHPGARRGTQHASPARDQHPQRAAREPWRRSASSRERPTRKRWWRSGSGRLRARITREAAADLALRAGKRVFALVKSISFEPPARS